MFGTLRLVLAALVVLFHAGNSPYEIRIGVSAVIVFYMISGFAMSGLYSTRFFGRNVRHFYIERIIRIMPQYYFIWLCTFIMLYGFDIWIKDFPNKNLGIMDVFSNLTLIPMGLTIYFPFLMKFALIGHAVSLANEMIFYVLVPLVLVYRLVTVVAFIISMIVFCLATQSSISAVAFSYNYLPGPIIFFVIGHLLYIKKWNYLIVAIIPLAMNQLYLLYKGGMLTGFNLDIYVGFYVGFAAMLLLMNLKPNKLDHFLGTASYGCFLGHLPLLIAFRYFNIFENNLLMFSISLLFFSIIIGFISYFLVERPTQKYRYYWRDRSNNMRLSKECES